MNNQAEARMLHTIRGLSDRDLAAALAEAKHRQDTINALVASLTNEQTRRETEAKTGDKSG